MNYYFTQQMLKKNDRLKSLENKFLTDISIKQRRAVHNSEFRRANQIWGMPTTSSVSLKTRVSICTTYSINGWTLYITQYGFSCTQPYSYYLFQKLWSLIDKYWPEAKKTAVILHLFYFTGSQKVSRTSILRLFNYPDSHKEMPHTKYIKSIIFTKLKFHFQANNKSRKFQMVKIMKHNQCLT